MCGVSFFLWYFTVFFGPIKGTLESQYGSYDFNCWGKHLLIVFWFSDSIFMVKFFDLFSSLKYLICSSQRVCSLFGCMKVLRFYKIVLISPITKFLRVKNSAFSDIKHWLWRGVLPKFSGLSSRLLLGVTIAWRVQVHQN